MRLTGFLFIPLLLHVAGHVCAAADTLCTREAASTCLERADELARVGNKEEANRLFESACLLNQEIPCARAADFAINHNERDKALTLYEKACNLGYMPSCSSLGYFLRKENPERAKQLFEKACQAADRMGCYYVKSPIHMLANALVYLVMILPSILIIACAFGSAPMGGVALAGVCGIAISLSITFGIAPGVSEWQCRTGYGDCTGQGMIGYLMANCLAVVLGLLVIGVVYILRGRNRKLELSPPKK